jgi:ABC-type bacteriocin/lantibiotic exporter with double-glycine peptidase domain
MTKYDNLTSPQLVLLLWHSLSFRRRLQLLLVLVLSLVACVTELMSIGAVLPFLLVITDPVRLYESPYVQPLVSYFNIPSAEYLLMPAVSIFIGIAMFSAFLKTFLMWLQFKVSNAIGIDIGFEIFRKSLYQEYSFFTTRNSTEIIIPITHYARSVVSTVIIPILLSITSLITITVIAVLLIMVEPLITSMTISAFALIYILISFFTKKRLGILSKQLSVEEGRVAKILQEGFGGIRDVLIDGTQEVFCSLYRRASTTIQSAETTVNLIGGAPRYIIESISICILVLGSVALSRRPEGFAVAIPVIGAIALGAQRMLPLAQQLYVSWTNLRSCRERLIATLYFLARPLPSWASNPSSLIVFEKRICLKSVSFVHAGSNAQVLKNINISIAKGARVGIIGKTGSGKSTLLDILMGLIHPTSGSLCVDEVDINRLNNRGWQKHIAHVPQNIFLSDGSIAQNIALGIPTDDIDINRVKMVAEIAQLKNFLLTLPNGLHTTVGERGVRLSGGQRQRIGIARALYKGVDVMVFDEATSALDEETEGLLMNAINNLPTNLTVIMVAHRLNTLNKCDYIIEIKEGVIISQEQRISGNTTSPI